MQILYLSGRQSHANCTHVGASHMKIPIDFIHVACDWRPRGYNLHALGACTVQSRQFFASTLREKYFCQKRYIAIYLVLKLDSHSEFGPWTVRE
jgi:hypothetical protein